MLYMKSSSGVLNLPSLTTLYKKLSLIHAQLSLGRKKERNGLVDVTIRSDNENTLAALTLLKSDWSVTVFVLCVETVDRLPPKYNC